MNTTNGLCLRAVICVIAAACVGIATSARADALTRAGTPRVLVIAAQAEAGSPEAEVIDAVRHALSDFSEVRLLPPSPLDLEAVQLAIDCTDESVRCFGEIAARMEAQIVIVPSLKRRADVLELHIKRFQRGASQEVATAMRKQAGTRLDATLLDTVPSMLREVMSLSADEEPAVESIEPAEPAPRSAPVQDAEEPSDGGLRLPLGPVLLGGGGLSLLVAGVVVGAMASSTEDDYASRTIDTIEQAEQADALREQGESEALVANILLGTGVAALIGAGAWYILDAPSEHAQDSARLLPVLGPHSAGLVLSGRFQAQP